MAKQVQNAAAQCRTILDEISRGIYRPVYLLMGEEAYYPDIVCKAIIDNCIDESSKDFNELICYGADVTAEQVISAARQFPMMSERVLVVIREAQLMKTLEQLSLYCAEPLDSTVLVILMHGASADKRKALYKNVSKTGTVMESSPIRDYEIASWISSYYSSKGLEIDADAAELLGESVGTNLSTIALETDKLLKALPEGTRSVSVKDIEKNVGASREYSIFELTKALSYRDAKKALKIASRIGDSARFALPAAVSALYTHFNRILRYSALLQKNRYPGKEDKAAALVGVNPYFYREYDEAVRNYPLPKAMAVISLLCRYDSLGKGGGGGVATEPGELLVELTARILNV